MAINLLFYMDVRILEKVEQGLRTSKMYWIVDVVPLL